MRKLVIVWLLVLCGCARTKYADPIPKHDFSMSASVQYYYLDGYLKGKELLESINVHTLVSIATVNADNTPNIALFAVKMLDDEYLTMICGSNQTLANLKTSSMGMLSYFIDPQNDGLHANHVKGAKIVFTLVQDPIRIGDVEVLHSMTLRKDEYLLKIMEIRPLG